MQTTDPDPGHRRLRGSKEFMTMHALPVSQDRLASRAPSALSLLSWFFYLESVPITRAVIEGRTSLGGSESALLGLCRALAAQGQDVHIFAAKLSLADDDPREYDGVQWHPHDELDDICRFSPPDVFVSLRMASVFQRHIPASLKLLWNQDMLGSLAQVAHALTQVDALVYVSEYHRQQWSSVDPGTIGAMPSWVTRNGFDPALLNSAIKDVARIPRQYCYISRPERALGPLLAIWPLIRARVPDATLKVCRYDSMYDAAGWGRVCAQYDEQLAAVNAKVGGIEMVGNLSKPDLYRLIASSVAMLYPGVDDFAETSCIAAIEAQACGTWFVGSYKGALPETLAAGAGVLIQGEAQSAAYRAAFAEEAIRVADRCVPIESAGVVHVYSRYTFGDIAADWLNEVRGMFVRRFERHKLGVLRQLLHWDHHVAAESVAKELMYEYSSGSAEYTEALDALALCHRVVAQEDLNADQYGEYSLDPEQEMRSNGRFQRVLDMFRERAEAGQPPRRLLDVACGNGSFALLMAETFPDLCVDAWDFSAVAVRKGQEAAQRLGLANRVTFHVGAYTDVRGTFDAVFCGEFLEHLERPWELIDRLEQHCAPGGLLVLTTPCGPFTELLHYTVPLHRGHTHAFLLRDLMTMLDQKADANSEYLPAGYTPRGQAVGFFIVSWAPGGGPAVPLDYMPRILTTRPYQRLVAGLIVKDGEEWIQKCLLSLWGLVDDVVLYHNGRDRTAELARAFPNVHVVAGVWPDDFSVARNSVLDYAQTRLAADWFLWIDADEHLVGGPHLSRYLQTMDGPFLGFVIRQHHVSLDADRFFDVPCRVFRTNRGIRFFGVVHEQPETAIDKGIEPSIDCPDVNIVHYGYETQEIRSEKLLTRNLDLLRRELAGKGTHPARELAWLIYVRDLVNLGQHLVGLGRTVAPEQLSRRAREKFVAALTVARKHGFDKPTHKLHHLIWPSYQMALRALGIGIEIEWAFRAEPRRLPPGRVVTEKFIATSIEEGEALITHKTHEWLEMLRPVSFNVVPWAKARPADIVIESGASAASVEPSATGTSA